MSIAVIPTLTGQLTAVGNMQGRISGSTDTSGSLSVPKIISPDSYDGQTVITPSDTEQVLHTDGLIVPSDIIIEAIPNNYGLITWNGSTLTVS